MTCGNVNDHYNTLELQSRLKKENTDYFSVHKKKNDYCNMYLYFITDFTDFSTVGDKHKMYNENNIREFVILKKVLYDTSCIITIPCNNIKIY
jgi:hypothetical protein